MPNSISQTPASVVIYCGNHVPVASAVCVSRGPRRRLVRGDDRALRRVPRRHAKENRGRQSPKALRPAFKAVMRRAAAPTRAARTPRPFKRPPGSSRLAGRAANHMQCRLSRELIWKDPAGSRLLYQF